VHRILTFVTRLTSCCLRSLHHRFVAWTKPDTTSLLLGTLTDLARSKSELVAENAFLRKPLIILRRQVKRPACTKTDRMILVLLARAVRTWKQALFIVRPETLLQWHRQGCAPVLEVQVQSSIFQTKDTRRNRGFDQGNGERNGSVANYSSWASASPKHHSEVHEAYSYAKRARTELGHFPAEPCARHLGV
jgi:hypothetical protein